MSLESRAEAAGGASRFALTLTDILDRVSYRKVDLKDLSDPVYRLRYEAYRREEFIAVNSQKVSGDQFDHTPNAMCFGVYIDEQLVSSIRLHHATPEMPHSPSRSIFGDILDPWLESGLSFLDPSRFTADHEATLAFPALPFLTTRLVVMASDFFGVDYCLSSVRPEHGAFYKRVFRSEKMTGERYYPGLNFPVCMFAADVPRVLDGIYSRYPFYRSTLDEQQALFGRDPASFSGARIRTAARHAQRHLEQAPQQVLSA